MGQDVVGQNFLGQDVTGAISLGQEVSGAGGSGAGSRESLDGLVSRNHLLKLSLTTFKNSDSARNY